VEQDLNWTTVVGFKGVNQAALGARGPNLRARDVITTFVGTELAGGATLNSDGFVEDGEDDTLPEVRFLVEGVRAGAENSTEIEVLIDGEPLEQRINVGEEGSPVESGPGWSDFEVVIEDFDLERDLTREDTRPNEPRKHTWETRVFENESRYSAHRADPVVFSGTIRAKGEIAQINQMEQVPNVEVTVNELVLEFPSDGGAVSGDYQGTAESPALTVQFALSMEGSYDATSGLIEGTVSGSTTGSSPSPLLSFFNQEGGVLRGTVDHDAGTVDIALEGDGQSIPVNLQYG
jgi:hypothetical protein